MKILLCFIIFLFFVKGQCLASKSDKKNKLLGFEFGNPLSKMIASIIIAFYSESCPEVSIVRASEDRESEIIQLEVINEVLYETSNRTLVRLEDSPSNLPQNMTRAYNLFFIDSYQSFRKIIFRNTTKAFNYMGYYTIVLTSVPKNYVEVVTKIFEDCWRLYIINVNVVTHDPHNAKISYMLTYFPYTPSHCGQVNPVITAVIRENIGVSHAKIFPEKVSNFYGCKLTVGTFQVPPYIILKQQEDGRNILDGFEGIISRVLSQRLNFTLIAKLSKGRWGHFNWENSTGAKLQLFRGEVNFTVGRFSASLGINDSLLYTVGHYTTYLTLIIPPGRPLTSMEKLFFPFDLNTWCCVALCFIVSAIVVTVAKYVLPHRRAFVFGRANHYPFINTIDVFLGASIHRTPGRNFARFLLLVWIVMSLVLRSSYQGALFRFLTCQNNVSLVDTLPKLAKEGFKIYGQEGIATFLSSLADYGLTYNIIDADEVDTYRLKILDSNFKGAFAGTLTTVAHLNEKFSSQNIRFRTISENIVPYYISMAMRPYSYLKEPFEKELERYRESGLIKYWVSKFHNERYLKDDSNQEIPRPLTFNQLNGIFLLYLILMTFSFFVFLLELLSKKSRLLRRLFNFLN
uniref:Uncharacterized protein n=1 Tax=Phlebotomus papatasi TaxID=29031 RepID=A0A3F2ZEN3_PHLPP